MKYIVGYTYFRPKPALVFRWTSEVFGYIFLVGAISGVCAFLQYIREKGGHAVEIFGGERVELVVMAFRAGHG